MGEKGEDVNHGNVNLPGEFTEDECLLECKKKREEVGSQLKACEWKNNKECMYHTIPIKKGNDNSNYTCCIFNGGTFDFLITTLY